MLDLKDFCFKRSSKSAYPHIDIAIEVIGNFPLKRIHFISVSQWKVRRFVLFTTRNRTFKLQLMEHLLTETLLVGRIRLKFDAIRLPGDSFCRLSAGTMSENLWNVCRKISQSRKNIYSCDRKNLIYDICGVCKIDYYKNKDCTSSACKTIKFSTTKLKRITGMLQGG